ncbi:enoyl-CoA hydratase/isomerase family protein [Oceanibaculum pacificum]|uniref:Enoyl-CoA hydratase n=1 Tax=Oceanibaculum pacificum TaxID=580166 RepID=A0A154WFR5_9PROT|nr:enoyl-CoA hydratase-related protein [Oceanibaculum pacificum]KZD12352.1 enoyl-CoA hydratase [Oceanibaculum pacificum]
MSDTPPSTPAPVVLVERKDHVAMVTLNRPEKLNALNKAMWIGVRDAFREISADDSVRCVLFTGAGERAFCPGADISEFESARADAAQARDYGHLMDETMGAIADCPHPVVVMIKGICVGGGLELASMADLRICQESSRFGVPINKLGLTMGYKEIAALIGLVGKTNALEILYEARVFGAAEAKEKGLVNRVVPDDKIEEEGWACVTRIVDGAPLVNRWHKKFARRLEQPAPLTQADYDEGYDSFDTQDFQTGYKAFLAKRKPVFEGR